MLDLFTDNGLYSLECQLVALVAGGLLIGFVLSRVSRSRPGLAIGRAIAAAFVLRTAAAVGLEQTPIAGELRGGDEVTFLSRAQDIVAQFPINTSGAFDELTDELHVFLFSLHYRVLDDVPEMMLRFEMIALAVVGLTLLAAAVYELAGPRAALIAAWLLALEPTGIFFSGLLHKEPLMFLAEGMVAFGGAALWKRGDLRALLPIVLGCAIGTATRPYVGWFLTAAAALIALHASLKGGFGRRSLGLAVVVLAIMGAFVPTVLNATSKERLGELQASQDANADDDDANLALEQINYSSRGKVIANLPTRVRDVVLRPYPWQVANTSQQLGVIGTLVMFCGLLLLIGALLRNGGAVMRRAGPLVYLALMLLVAYSLSAGNAGTAFRYRSHVVGLMICLLLVLHRRAVETRATARAAPGLKNLSAVPRAG
ncbi:MAG: hypothetical protein ACR2KP_05520 [Egibacteraceae bacterium]